MLADAICKWPSQQRVPKCRSASNKHKTRKIRYNDGAKASTNEAQKRTKRISYTASFIWRLESDSQRLAVEGNRKQERQINIINLFYYYNHNYIGPTCNPNDITMC